MNFLLWNFRYTFLTANFPLVQYFSWGKIDSPTGQSSCKRSLQQVFPHFRARIITIALYYTRCRQSWHRSDKPTFRFRPRRTRCNPRDFEQHGWIRSTSSIFRAGRGGGAVHYLFLGATRSASFTWLFYRPSYLRSKLERDVRVFSLGPRWINKRKRSHTRDEPTMWETALRKMVLLSWEISCRSENYLDVRNLPR